VIYRLPEVRQAIAAGKVIIAVEGEKDADNLWAIGLAATCNPDGASGPDKKPKWRAEYSEMLRGAELVVTGDNDEPGRAHIEATASMSTGIAARVLDAKHWHVPPKQPGGEPGKDVSDWLAAGHNREELDALLGAAALYKASNHELKSVRISDVEMSAITWWWPSRFGIGKLGLIVGLPDEGKGQILAYLAARVTTGTAWPMNEGKAPIGNVIYIQCEDGLKDTIKPRLLAAGADPERVHLIETMMENGKERMFSLQTDLEFLRRKVTEIGDVKLILIDPIHAYLGVGKVDSFRNADVRAVLGPLTIMLEEMNIAAIGIMHFNKKTDVTNALLRISDSLAYGAVARHVYAAVGDDDNGNNGRKLLVRAKNNLAKRDNDRTLAYHFNEKYVGNDPTTGAAIYAPFITFDDEYVDVTASEAMSAAAENKEPGARDRAKTLLSDLLASGKPIDAKEIEGMAKAEGIAKRTLMRAKDALKVKSVQAEGRWSWVLQNAK
jgi:putative DNA primase/helicase